MAVLGKPEDRKQAPETPGPVTRWKLVPGWVEPWRARLSDWGKRTRILRRRLLLFLAVVGPGRHHLQRRQRRRRNLRLFAGRRDVRLCVAVVAHSHDHRALRHGRNVRPHGRRDRQGPFRPYPRRVRFPSDVFSDPRRTRSWTWAMCAPNLRALPPPCSCSAFPSIFPSLSPRLPSGFSCSAEPPARSKKYFWRPAFCIFPMWSPRFWPSRIGSWRRADTAIPTMHLDGGYLLMLTALIGTTIAPWQFFYMQASFVEKRVSARQYRAGSHGRALRQRQLHGHRLLHHRLHRRHAVRFRPSRHQRCRRCRAGPRSAGRKMGRHAFCVRPPERVAVRRIHPAALHRSRHLRRHGI